MITESIILFTNSDSVGIGLKFLFVLIIHTITTAIYFIRKAKVDSQYWSLLIFNLLAIVISFMILFVLDIQFHKILIHN